LPLVAKVPVQSDSAGVDEAAHEVALVLDHVSVIACPTAAVAEEAENVTAGFAGGGGVGVLPPPQPFQITTDRNTGTTKRFKLAFIEAPTRPGAMLLPLG